MVCMTEEFGRGSLSELPPSRRFVRGSEVALRGVHREVLLAWSEDDA
jgi:hypothetical protein